MLTELQALAAWTGWPILVGALLLVGGIGFWLLRHRIATLQDMISTSRLPQNPRISLKGCGIRIVSPRSGDEVPRSFRAYGTLNEIPLNHKLWIFTARDFPGGREYWPQGNYPANIDELNQTWASEIVWLGEDRPKGSREEVAALIVGPNGQALIDYYIRAGTTTGSWPGILRLTEDMQELASQVVIFGGEEKD